MKQILVRMQPVLIQRLPQRLLHIALPGDRPLPIREANDAHDLVDVVDDALDEGGAGSEDQEKQRIEEACWRPPKDGIPE